MSDLTQCKPNPTLASILRNAPVSPSAKLQAVCLLRGETFGVMARRLGRSRVTFSMMVNGREDSEELRQAAAQDIGVSVDDIWTPMNRTFGEPPMIPA